MNLIKDKIKLGVAEDHKLFRETMIRALQNEGNILIEIQAGNGQELLDKLITKKVDIILLDLDMPILGGREAMKLIKRRYAEIKIIIVSMHYTKTHVEKYMSLGANGYLYKGCDFDDLTRAIKEVHDTGIHINELVTLGLLKKIIANKINPLKFIQYEPLSKRELEVLLLLCEQLSNSEIAAKLEISTRTVENHREHMYKKTGARNSVGLLAYAITKGIYELKI